MLRTVLRSPSALYLQRAVSIPTRRSTIFRLLATESKQPSDQAPAAESSSSGVSTNPSEATADPSSDGTTSDASHVEQLTKQLEEKDAQIAELNDRTLRTLAEMENVRMIARRDVDNARKYAAVPFATSLLSVADNLGLALSSVDEKLLQADDVNPQLKGLHIGVAATESELLKVFSQHGITRFGEVGDKFDPNKYQAMFEAPTTDVEPGTVTGVTKMGYQLGDRILRPAEVGVSRAP